MTIQAVFFDMGGTIDTYEYTRESRLAATPGIQQLMHNAGVELHLTDEQLYTAITRGLEGYKTWSLASMLELPPSRVWSEFIFADCSFDHAKLEGIAEELSFFIETRYYCRTMRPEIPAVLKAIQQMGLKIGLISNVNSRGQVPFNLKEYGIYHYFDQIVLSSEYGHRKPDPAIFHYAARLANVPTSASLHVGDRVMRDVDGARRAGYSMAIQIRHNFEHGENDIGAVPTAVIDDMTQLLSILQADQNRKNFPVEQGEIRALFFDAGDILYYRPERRGYFIAFLHELGLNISENHTERKKALERQAFCGQITLDQYREGILRMYSITQPEQVERGKQALEMDDDQIVFFEGVRETLLALKARGYLLGVITDTTNTVSTKMNWFERGGFGQVWDSIIASAEIGMCKPDPDIYRAALHQLGLSPEQAVFVGHKPYELDGGRAIGMHTIAFNYEKGACADFYIEHFSDLLNVPGINGHDRPG